MNDQPTHKGAEFSADRRYRYKLWRVWDGALPYMQVIGLNPSTADELQDDPTIRRCIRFAKDLGFGGLVMTNIFAFRATDPAVMREHYLGQPLPLEEVQNLKTICDLSVKAGLTLAAWGAGHLNIFNRANEVARAVPNLHCLKLTKGGDPSHPLYLKANSKPIPFRQWTTNQPHQ